MEYDFDRIVDRSGTYSIKWDIGDNELPMWVADMDFKSPPEITDAMQQRISNGIFGYTYTPEEWKNAYTDWWSRRHHFTMEPDWLLFSSAVIPAISSCIRKLTLPGDGILIMTPVYNNFYHAISCNGRKAVESELVYENNRYHIDFEDLEHKLSDPQTVMMILCNPHNPIGKIWDKDTLAHIGELCDQYHVIVISDEIHCDLTMPGCAYTPFASVNETCRAHSITCISPSKTFNLAGIHTAAVAVPDPYLRKKVQRAFWTDGIAEPSVFAVTATIAAYTKGEEWLDQLRVYIREGRELVQAYLAKELPGIKMVSEDATYLLWLDCTQITENSREFTEYIRSRTGLFLTCGSQYRGNGNGFVRMNIACPHKMTEDGLERLKKGMEAYGMK